MDIKKEIVLKELRKIIDPDFNKNIVELEFIKELEIDEGKVKLNIELTTPACPVKEDFRKQAESLIRALPKVKKVEIIMSARKRSNPLFGKSPFIHLTKVENIIGVASCKGGVGKSTVAASLAKEISERGFKVGLFDTDIFGPSLPALFDLFDARIYMKNNLIQPLKISEHLKVMSFGFLLKNAPAIMRGAMVTNYIKELIQKVEWGELDYLFIDMPPGTGDIQLTLSQNIKINGIVIVTTPHLLSLVDVMRGIIMFEKVNIPILNLVENMSYFVCNECDTKHNIFEKSKISLKERFGIESNLELPFVKKEDLDFKNYKSNEWNKNLANQVIQEIGKKTIALNQPPKVSYNDEFIYLNYEKESLKIKNFTLRTNCACALCKDEMTGKPKINLKNISKTIKPLEISPLGNYALSINWSDGHSSGIYTYKLIKSLKEENEVSHKN